MKSTPLALVSCCLLSQASGAATLVVAEARGIALKPGATLDSTKPLALKQGQHVTLISETGSTLKLDGPYNQPPVAAGAGTGGRSFGIMPGKPDDSIMLYRISSAEPGIMMPELGRGSVHKEGAALIRDWIAAMPQGCNAN